MAAPERWAFYQAADEDAWRELIHLLDRRRAGDVAEKILQHSIHADRFIRSCTWGTIRGFSVDCEDCAYTCLYATQAMGGDVKGFILSTVTGTEPSEEAIEAAHGRFARLVKADPSVQYL